MRMISLLRVEVGRIFRDRMTWLCILLTMAAPLLGLSIAGQQANTVSEQYLATPALWGTMVGTVVFMVLTVLRLSRIPRSGADMLIDAIASPVRMAVASMAALLCAATAAGLLTMLIYLPFTLPAMGDMFRLSDYMAAYLVLMMPGMWLGCLLAAGLYQITRRIDLTIVLCSVCVLVSLSPIVFEEYLLRWFNPLVPALSDVYTNAKVFRSAAYNRLFWLLVFGGLWCVSLLCLRRYGKGVAGSAAQNIRRPVALVLAVILLAGGALAYAKEPFINNEQFSTMRSLPIQKNIKHAYLLSTEADVKPDPKSGTLEGEIRYKVRNLNREVMRIHAGVESGYTVRSLTINGKAVPFEDDNQAVLQEKKVYFDMPPEADLEIIIRYGGMPRTMRSLRANLGGNVISDIYMELLASGFAPALPLDMDKEGAHYTALIRLPGGMTPITLQDTSPEVIETHADGSKTWRISLTGPRISLYAADFVVEDVSVGDMRILFYYARAHGNLLREARINDAIRDVMQFCLRTFGALPYGEDNPLRIMQSSVFQFGGYATSGVSVMDEVVFTGNNLVDPLRGAQKYEVIAHELIHQWWGGERMLIGDEPEWSSEGFTVYSTYLMMKDKYGEAYARQYYVDVWQAGYDDYIENFYTRHPEYLDRLPQTFAEQILAMQAGTRTYCEMPLKMMRAAELLGGEDALVQIMRDMYVNGSPEKIITYDDFLDACGLTREDLTL